MRLTAIAAVDSEGGIARRGAIPWPSIPEDTRRFVGVTRRAGVVLMGRTTWLSLPEDRRPLRGRLNVVLTRSPPRVRGRHNPLWTDEPFGVLAALEAAGYVEAVVIGGEEVYRLYWPFLGTLHLTTVGGEPFGCDRFLPGASPPPGFRSVGARSGASEGGRPWVITEYQRALPSQGNPGRSPWRPK